MRRTVAVLGAMLFTAGLAAPTAAQTESYNLADLEQRCEENSPNAELRDSCLFILFEFLLPDAGREAPDSTGGLDEPVTRTGSRGVQTSSFLLSGGDYLVEYVVWNQHSHGCFFGGSLRTTGGASWEVAGETTPEARQTRSGETYVYDLPAGLYFFDIIAGCENWQLTISPS
jgi:hypothetical protein